MRDNKINEAILSDDLRNTFICIGKLGEEMEKTQLEKNEDLLRQLQSLVQSISEVYADFRAATQVEIREIKKDIDGIGKTILQQSEQISKIYAKLNNGLSERIKRIECIQEGCGENYVTRREFNESMKSIRLQVNSMKWMVGLMMTGIFGAMVTLIIV
jgi:hypothetical protein